MKNKIIDLFFEKENNTLKQNNIGWIIYLIIVILLAILLFPVFNTFLTEPKLLNDEGVLSLIIECNNSENEENKKYCILSFAPNESNLELETVDFKLYTKGIDNTEVLTYITYDTPPSVWKPNNKGLYSIELYPDIRLFEQVFFKIILSNNSKYDKASIELKNIKIIDTDGNYYKIDSVSKEIEIR